MGTGDLSLGLNRQLLEADLSPPSSVDVKKTWIYTPTFNYAFMV
jgi:hypothetical protein